jgi:MFS family permease
MHTFRQNFKTGWPGLFGYMFFTGMMAAGYFYNVTFVQLGLTDLGKRIIGMSDTAVAFGMAGLALLALITALAFGYWMRQTNRSANFFVKLRFVFFVVVIQTILTAAASFVYTELTFYAWIGIASLALGVGMPVTFSLTVDLIARRHRGMVAGLVTAAAYFSSNAFSSSTWQMEHFQRLALLIMVPGTLTVGFLVLARPAFLLPLSRQHLNPLFAIGRFVHQDSAGNFRVQRSLIGLLFLMFGVFFIDSLGFLRLLDTPLYMNTAWQSEDANIHLFIAWTHVVAALIGGVLYTYLSERHLFLWIFGTFAVAHLQYLFHASVGSATYAPLSMPMLYAIAVSLYTVVNFAIWADISTPQSISFNTAVGVALSGWSATFLSTAVGIYWGAIQMPLETHLRIVGSLAIVFFLGVLILLYFTSGTRLPIRQKLSEGEPK